EEGQGVCHEKSSRSRPLLDEPKETCHHPATSEDIFMSTPAPQPYLAQVWVLPPLDLKEPLVLGITPAVTLKTVQLRAPDSSTFPAALLQTDGTGSNMEESPERDMRRLGQVLSRMSFALVI